VSGRSSTKRRSSAELLIAIPQPAQERPDPALLPALIVERRRMLEARLRLAQANPAPIRTSTRVEDGYSCPELSEPAVRLGADDHIGLPSRRGDWLVYRDGREVRVDLQHQGAA
jgi:hypothetical protein